MPPPASPRPKLFYGWRMAWVYFVLNFYWGGTLLVGFSALFNPIRETFGLSAIFTLATFALTSQIARAPDVLDGMVGV